MTISEPRDFHHFALGRPRDHVYQEVGTDVVPAAERYDFWTQSLIRGLAVDAPDELQTRDFNALALSLATPTGEMHLERADGFSGRRTRAHIRGDDNDETALLYMVEGRVRADYEDDSGLVVEAGEFLLLDTARPLSLAFDGRHSFIQIDLPRARLAPILGTRFPAPSLVTEALRHSRLSPLLRAQLMQFCSQVPRMSPGEQLTYLQASEDFAIAMLEGALAQQWTPGLAGGQASLLTAARRYIDARVADPALSAERVAAALGCSRATLYRAFEACGQAVGEWIRETRLSRARSLLERRPAISTARVAAYTGFASARHFHRAFKARFGMTPGEFRRQVTSPLACEPDETS